ncbi:MAG: hypothetical protein VB853_08745 [Pirellulales bacterium]
MPCQKRGLYQGYRFSAVDLESDEAVDVAVLGMSYTDASVEH